MGCSPARAVGGGYPLGDMLKSAPNCCSHKAVLSARLCSNTLEKGCTLQGPGDSAHPAPFPTINIDSSNTTGYVTRLCLHCFGRKLAQVAREGGQFQYGNACSVPALWKGPN